MAYKPPKRWLIFEGKVISHQKGGFFSSEARHHFRDQLNRAKQGLPEGGNWVKVDILGFY